MEVLVDLVPSEGYEGESIHESVLPCGGSDILGLWMAIFFHVSLHHLTSVCFCLCVQTSHLCLSVWAATIVA